MDDLSKKEISFILKGIQSLKSDVCLRNSQLGLYLTNRLSSEERIKVECHLEKCLYCINQLTELKELIYLETSEEGLFADQVKKFSQNLTKHYSGRNIQSDNGNPAASVGQRFGAWLFPSFQWKYVVSFALLMTSISLVSMYVTIKIKNPDLMAFGKRTILTATAENNLKQSAVKVDLLDTLGKNIQTVSGVVIDSNGLVMTSLKELKKADSARVNFSDGRSLPVVGVRVDEASNLAFLKISQKNLVPVRFSRPRSLQIGEKFIHISDPTNPASTATHVVITQVSAPKQDGGEARQYFEITGPKPLGTGGILVNPEGETVGKLIDGGGNVGSVVTFDYNKSFVPSENFIPISLIGK